MSTDKIYVTRPYLPPKNEFDVYLAEIWKSRELTNSGKFHRKLENSLVKFLGVKHISLFSSGTSALIVALRALDIGGEVITTPYSFVATSHALEWNGIKPVFADVAPGSFNIDPLQVEKLITKKTTAILAVHCYGYPADILALDLLAKKYNIRLIYDAAHAFGVGIKNNSILNAGDLSILSFHATKVFNTFEGGAIVCSTLDMKERIDSLKNFGFVNEVAISAVGINGKMAEINAALGLAQLPHFDEVLASRAQIDAIYRARLKYVEGIDLHDPGPEVTQNYSYFPITINNSYLLTRDELFEKFRNENIMVRRYFYPLISDFSVYRNAELELNAEYLINAKKVANQILCLPIYPDLTEQQVHRICDVINPRQGKF
jgi:dTDP-4-amino-4,6-dideoxygalactose transaminase